MGIDTKGFVLTEEKNVFKIRRAVLAAIRSLTDSEVRVEFSDNSELLRFIFEYPGDGPRTLWVFFDCDSDHRDYGEKSISYMLGCWGDSVKIISAVGRHLAYELNAKAYIDENDCDDKSYYDVEEGHGLTA